MKISVVMYMYRVYHLLTGLSIDHHIIMISILCCVVFDAKKAL